MKKIISILLAVCIGAGTFVPALALNADKEVPAVVDFFEKIGTGVICVFAGLFSDVEKPDDADCELKENWQKYEGGNFIDNPERVMNAETFVANEIEYVSEKAYSDPFNDVEVSLILTGCGRQYTIPGFWAGENKWKFRFVCPFKGVWQFKTQCSDGTNSDLNGRTGQVNCAEYSGSLEIYKRGFVTAKEGKKYFTYYDGTPFFYLGDTHWSLGDETTEMVRTICKKRVEQGFTVIQSEPIGAMFDLTNGVTAEDMCGFEVYDEKFRIIAENGLVHANAEFFFPSYMEILINNFGGFITTEKGKELSPGVKDYLRKISRYWVARYSAYPVMWTLGQEVDNDFYWSETSHPDWNSLNNPYRLVAQYIAGADPYSHPLSAHQENVGSTGAFGNGKGAEDQKYRVYNKNADISAFFDVPEHDWFAAQWSPSKTGQTDFRVQKDYWYNSKGKPSVNYEGSYCGLWTKNFGARMQGYLAYTNGMYGYGWGGHDTWSYLNIYDENNNSNDGVDEITAKEKVDATWETSLEYPSSYQVGYMKNFLQKTQWWNLLPRFGSKAYFTPCSNVYYSICGNEANTETVLYFYSFTDKTVAQKTNTKAYGGVMTGTVGRLTPGGTYELTWFNPVTGEYGDGCEMTASRFGTLYIGQRNINGKPCDCDMALIIREKTK